jgi:hypothetical protein
MGRAKLGTQRRRRLAQGFLLLCLPLLMGQENCTPNPDPKTTANPVALDCILAGNQVFIPIDLTVALDRYPTAGTGMFADVSVMARIPADVFCALEDVPMTQTELQSSTVVTEFGGVFLPGSLSATSFALDMPIPSIDVSAACAGAYGPEILLDYGTIPTTPWSDGAWTVDFMVSATGMRFWLTNIVPSPPSFVDLMDLCTRTDKSNPPNGTTNDPEDSPRISADRDGDGDYEALATATDQVQFNVNGFCVGYRCDDFNDCTIDTCDVQARWCFYDNEPDGTFCNDAGQPGTCSAGTCVPLPWEDTCILDPSQCTKEITVGCTNNVTGDVTILPIVLTVTPQAPVIAGTVVPVKYSGLIVFPEPYTAGAQPAAPGLVPSVDLVDLQATVHVRSGATAGDVTLTNPPLPKTCLIVLGTEPTSCDPANDGASVPGFRPNTDCVPTGSFNPCQQRIAVPSSADCAPGGTCEMLGPEKVQQCAINGFCFTGGLPIPFAEVSTTITPDASGVVSFGWDDQSTGATLNPDGTWNLPPAVFTNPTGPTGVKINDTGLSIALECTMAVDSNGPYGPVPPVPDKSSPTPTSQLLQFNIQVP